MVLSIHSAQLPLLNHLTCKKFLAISFSEGVGNILCMKQALLILLTNLFVSQAQRRARIHQLRLEKGAEKAAEELQKCEKAFVPLSY